jgi:hypothetical protein
LLFFVQLNRNLPWIHQSLNSQKISTTYTLNLSSTVKTIQSVDLGHISRQIRRDPEICLSAGDFRLRKCFWKTCSLSISILFLYQSTLHKPMASKFGQRTSSWGVWNKLVSVQIWCLRPGEKYFWWRKPSNQNIHHNSAQQSLCIFCVLVAVTQRLTWTNLFKLYSVIFDSGLMKIFWSKISRNWDVEHASRWCRGSTVSSFTLIGDKAFYQIHFKPIIGPCWEARQGLVKFEHTNWGESLHRFNHSQSFKFIFNCLQES